MKSHMQNHFSESASQNSCLKRGAMVLVKLPNGRTPDQPGQHVRAAMVWNVSHDENGKVCDMDLMWVSNPSSPERLQKMQKQGHVISNHESVYQRLGFNQPVIIDTRNLIHLPVNDDFFPSIRRQRSLALVNDVRTKNGVQVQGFASDGFLKVLETAHAKAQIGSEASLSRIFKGSVVLANLPNGKTPDVPGRFAKPAFVWDVHRDTNNRVAALGLLWMRPFKETNEVLDIMRDQHVMVCHAEDYKRMGLDRPTLIDTSHTITVPVIEGFFPKTSRFNQVSKYCIDTSTGQAIGVLGKMSEGQLKGVVEKVHEKFHSDRDSFISKKVAEDEQRRLAHIEKEFGLNKLKL